MAQGGCAEELGCGTLYVYGAHRAPHQPEVTVDVDFAPLVQLIKAHARVPENYNAGWDTVVEAFEDDEIEETLRDFKVTNETEALAAFAGLADGWMEQRAISDMLFSW